MSHLHVPCGRCEPYVKTRAFRLTIDLYWIDSIGGVCNGQRWQAFEDGKWREADCVSKRGRRMTVKNGKAKDGDGEKEEQEK